MPPPRRLLGPAFCACCACAPSHAALDGGPALFEDASEPSETDASGPAEAGANSARPDHEVSDTLRMCAEHGAPVATIDDAVARFNALPAATAACLVASLPRPLAVVATWATLSAQPAASKKSPRIFLLSPSLAISVVPEGDGASRVEFGQWVTPTRTIKAEIELPFSPPLALEQAFDHILYGDRQTACALCHRNEAANPALPGSFVSDAYRPLPSTLVSLEALSFEHRTCADSGDTSQRCAMYHALFDFGEVVPGAFADDVALFTEE